MRKPSLTFIVFGAAALISTAAAVTQGAISVTVQNLGPARNNTGSIAAAGHSAWLITLRSDTGAITGIDLGQDADALEGIFADMGQVALVSDDLEKVPTPVRDEMNGVNSLSLDSHFLITQNRVDVFPFSEDNDFANRSGYPADTQSLDFGSGTEMHGVIDLLPAGQATTIALAYLVVPDCGLFRGVLNVTTTQGEFVGININSPIPEPASLSIIAMAALGMVRRRKI